MDIAFRAQTQCCAGQTRVRIPPYVQMVYIFSRVLQWPPPRARKLPPRFVGYVHHQTFWNCPRFEELTAVKMRIVTPCGLEGGYKRFEWALITTWHYANLEDGGDTFLRNVVTTYVTTRRQNPEDHSRFLKVCMHACVRFIQRRFASYINNTRKL
jgi:hypothetical protein